MPDPYQHNFRAFREFRGSKTFTYSTIKPGKPECKSVLSAASKRSQHTRSIHNRATNCIPIPWVTHLLQLSHQSSTGGSPISRVHQPADKHRFPVHNASQQTEISKKAPPDLPLCQGFPVPLHNSRPIIATSARKLPYLLHSKSKPFKKTAD